MDPNDAIITFIESSSGKKARVTLDTRRLNYAVLTKAARKKLKINQEILLFKDDGSEYPFDQELVLESSNRVWLRRIVDGEEHSHVPLNLAILGSAGVGKSALTLQFVYGKFFEAYDPTVQDDYKKGIMIDGYFCNIALTDTAGMEDFQSIQDMIFNTKEGFLIV